MAENTEPKQDAEEAETPEVEAAETPAETEAKDEAPDEPKAETPDDAEAAAKRSEAAKKAAVTRAQNQRTAQAAEDLHKHLRNTVGAEVSIDQARQIVDMVATALNPE